MQHIKAGKVDVATIHDVDGSGFRQEHIEGMNVVQLAIRDVDKRLIPLAPVGSTGGGLDATRAAARSGYGPRKVRFRDQLPARQPTTA